MEMVAEIMSAFPQFTFDKILYEMEYNNVIVWFHMARFAKHGISIPKIFRDKINIEDKGSNIRDTHRYDPKLGWIKK